MFECFKLEEEEKVSFRQGWAGFLLEYDILQLETKSETLVYKINEG